MKQHSHSSVDGIIKYKPAEPKPPVSFPRIKKDIESEGGSMTVFQATITRVLLVVLGVGVLAYSAQAARLEGRMPNGSTIAGYDVGGKTQSQTLSFLKQIVKGHKIVLKAEDQTFEARDADLGVIYNLSATVSRAYFNKPNSTDLVYDLSQSKLAEFVKSVESKINRPYKNATLKVENSVVALVPAENGYGLASSTILSSIETAIKKALSQPLKLSYEVIKPQLRDQDTAGAKAQAEDLMSKEVSLTFENKSFKPDKQTIGTWLDFVEESQNGRLTLQSKINPIKIKPYLATVAKQVNIAAVQKKVTKSGSKETVTQEGKDGRALDENVVQQAIYNSLSSGKPLVGFALSAKTIPYTTKTVEVFSLDGLYIDINISTQRLIVFNDNQPIYESAITTGATYYDFGTPVGVGRIYAKIYKTRLRGGGRFPYDVPVDYWMPFNGQVGLHDATWRSGFGGQDYYYNGSHGCVNLPFETAKFIWDTAPIGTPVNVHY